MNLSKKIISSLLEATKDTYSILAIPFLRVIIFGIFSQLFWSNYVPFLEATEYMVGNKTHLYIFSGALLALISPMILGIKITLKFD